MRSMDAALIGLPLTDQWRRRFETQCGRSLRYLSVQELKRLPFRQMIRTLRGLQSDRLFILQESPGLAALLPAFLCLSALTRCREVVLVHPDLTQTPISRWRTFSSLASVISASLSGQASVRRGRLQAERLLNEPRQSAALTEANGMLYLKSDLWLGVAAGGSVGHVAGVINSLLGRGMAVDYAAVEPPLMTSTDVRYLPVAPPKSFGLPMELNPYRFQEMFTRSVRRQLPADAASIYRCVYQRMSLCNLSGVLLSRELGLPLILEYNGSEIWCSKNWGRDLRHGQTALAMEDACLRHAHLVITVSDVLRDELMERGVEPHRVVSHPNGIHPAVFDPERFSRDDVAKFKQQWNVPTEAAIVGFVGTFGPWHGVEKLAQAIRQLAEEQPAWIRRHPVHFLIVGDGLGMPTVKHLLSDPRCDGLATLTGLLPQAEAPLAIAACDLMVSPHVRNPDGSRFFGSPTKMFEYLAMGKPVIASDLEQIGEILADSLRVDSLPQEAPPPGERRLAVLTEPGDVAGLMDGVRFLVEQASWRRVLGENSRREALSKYTWDRHVDSILNGLQRACGAAPSPCRRAA